MRVALFGKMRSGKDTVGEILIKRYDFKRYAFGDGIGEIIHKYFPDTLKHGKPRHHYQFIGQQLRELDEDVWIKYLLKKVEADEPKRAVQEIPFNVVVTDARQYNEYLRLKENGYIIVKVETDEDIRLERMRALGDNFTLELLEHPTELQVDKVVPDVVIKNNGSLIDLELAVAKFVLDHTVRGDK